MYGETGVKIRWQTFCGGCFAGSDPLQVRRAVLGDQRPRHQRVVPPEAQPFPSDFTEPVVNAVAVQLLQAHESVDGHQDGGYALKSAAFIAPALVQGRASRGVTTFDTMHFARFDSTYPRCSDFVRCFGGTEYYLPVR